MSGISDTYYDPKKDKLKPNRDKLKPKGPIEKHPKIGIKKGSMFEKSYSTGLPETTSQNSEATLVLALNPVPIPEPEPEPEPETETAAEMSR